MSTKLNEQAAAGLILDNYPASDDLMLDGHTFAELKENAAVGVYTLSQLEDAATICPDPLLRWIVRVVQADGQRTDGKTDDGLYYDANLIAQALERGRDELNAVISAFRNL